MANVVEVLDVVKDFSTGGETVRALSGVSLTVPVGQFVAIMGASGSGKSTLLHLLAGLDQPTSGAVIVEGRDLAAMSDQERTVFRRRRLGFIFQAYNLLPTLDALSNVGLPAVMDSKNGKETDVRARSLLADMGLQNRERHRPQTLSGGEQQRVAIARALMNDPAVIFADEPTGNLDTRHGQAIWRLLARLPKDGNRTVIAVTHDPGGATFADRILVLKDGCIAGDFSPGGEGHAAFVATRYAELVG